MNIEEKPLNYGYGYNDTNSIVLIWSIEDVKKIRPDLSDDECLEVLGYVERKHDASLGVCWETIEIHADYCFPKKERATA